MPALYDQGYELRVFAGYIERRGNIYSLRNLLFVESKGGNYYELNFGGYTITVEANEKASFMAAVKAALSEFTTKPTTMANVLPPLHNSNATCDHANETTLDEFDVRLTSKIKNQNKMAIIRIVREFTGMDLKSAKRAVESAPTTIATSTNKAGCESLVNQISEIGESAVISPHARRAKV